MFYRLNIATIIRNIFKKKKQIKPIKYIVKFKSMNDKNIFLHKNFVFYSTTMKQGVKSIA